MPLHTKPIDVFLMCRPYGNKLNMPSSLMGIILSLFIRPWYVLEDGINGLTNATWRTLTERIPCHINISCRFNSSVCHLRTVGSASNHRDQETVEESDPVQESFYTDSCDDNKL